METKELILPAFLASALINGDLTGLEDRDLPMFEEILEATKGWNPVDVGESYFDDIYSTTSTRLSSDTSRVMLRFTPSCQCRLVWENLNG